MADRKISELTNLTGANLADDDEFPLVDTSADETKAITFGEFKTALDTATGFVRITGDTMTGNLSMGDNVKAIFGNGSDLQIYHDGSNSYVQDTAAGELILKSNGPSISFQKGDGTELFTVNTSGSSTLSYSGNPKLATTSSGVDITGVLTSDSLSVDGGTIKLDGNYPTGTGNVALGDAALDAALTGNGNTALGASVLSANTSGGNNTGVGNGALFATTTGGFNTAVGANGLVTNTTGAYNTAIGDSALRLNTTASENTAVGYQSLYSNVTGTENSALGRGALYNNLSSYNTSVGRNSMYNNTTGNRNVALGVQALLSNTTASWNTAVGYRAGYSNTTGTDNTAMGNDTLFSNTTGISNTLEYWC